MTAAVPEGQVTEVPLGRTVPVPVETYSVRGASHLRPDQQAILELVSTTFARALGEELGSILRLHVDLVVQPGQQSRWQALLDGLMEPYAAAVVRWGGAAGIGLITVEPDLAVALVDRMLGGPGQPSEHPHPFTDLEIDLLGDVYRRAVSSFASAIALVVTLAPEVGGFESRLGLIKAGPADAELVVVDVEVGAGDSGVAGRLSLALPALDVVAPIDAFVGSVGGGRVVRLDPRFGLLDAAVDVAARFAPVTATQEELSRLAVGDVITLPHPSGHPLSLLAGDVAYLPAIPGRRDGRYAVEIVDQPSGATS